MEQFGFAIQDANETANCVDPGQTSLLRKTLSANGSRPVCPNTRILTL